MDLPIAFVNASVSGEILQEEEHDGILTIYFAIV